MNSGRKILVLLVGVFSCLILSGSCAHLDYDSMSEEPLFINGKGKFDRENYRGARELFIKFKNRFPESEKVSKIRLYIADSYFYEKNYTEALVQYEIFLKYHPADMEADYAYYQLALCKKKDVNNYDRDQEPTRNAITAFEQVIERYPNSTYAADAKKQINDLKSLLARHDLYIGKFYLKIKSYKSAIGRFEHILRHYANLGHDTEAIYLLIKSLVQSDNLAEAAIWYENLETQYGSDEWTRKARNDFGKDIGQYSATSGIRKQNASSDE